MAGNVEFVYSWLCLLCLQSHLCLLQLAVFAMPTVTPVPITAGCVCCAYSHTCAYYSWLCLLCLQSHLCLLQLAVFAVPTVTPVPITVGCVCCAYSHTCAYYSWLCLLCLKSHLCLLQLAVFVVPTVTPVPITPAEWKVAVSRDSTNQVRAVSNAVNVDFSFGDIFTGEVRQVFSVLFVMWKKRMRCQLMNKSVVVLRCFVMSLCSLRRLLAVISIVKYRVCVLFFPLILCNKMWAQ